MTWCVVTATTDWTYVVLEIAIVLTVLLVALLVLTAMALIASELARNRGHDEIAGAVLGVLLGPFAWLLIVFVPRRRS